MRIRMQEGPVHGQLDFEKWDIGIVGSPLDDRGAAAIDFVKSNSVSIISAGYDAEAFKVLIEGTQRNAERTSEFFESQKGSRIVFETTTLGFVEMYLCLRALKTLEFKTVSMIYVEPGAFTTARGERLLHRRDFELSEEIPGFKAIPGATLVTTERTLQRTVFFLGFEERRLDVALQTQMIRPSDAIVIFGVPAFTPGWEMHSFANNVRVIRDNRLTGGVHFCGADSPAAAYATLLSIHESLLTGERLIVGPLGTKPHGIGAALFAATHPEVGLLYDHPRKSANRSEKVARWHLYEIDF
jgi:hypothetical protein